MTLRCSVGYEIEVRGRSRAAEQEAFSNVIEQAVRADQLGYDTVWMVEHHFTRGFSHSSAPDLVLAALSQRTSNIHLGLGVVLLPFNHPVRTAERVATLDVLSKGRVEFGTGRGASPLEYQAFQRPFEQSRQLWEDNLAAVLDIWKADGETVSAEHPYWSMPDVAVYPRPFQEPHPPVWVASTSLEGYLAAATKGYNLLGMTILKGLDQVAEDIAAYKKALAEHGFDPSSRRVALMIPWHVAPSEDEAHQTAADSILWYIRRQVNLVVPPGFHDARFALTQVIGQIAAGQDNDTAMSMLLTNRMAVLGDVAGSRQALKEFEEAGATDIICQFQVGGLGHPHVLDAINLFASHAIGDGREEAVNVGTTAGE
jgi:natural product biosynthesis luciferase-like monooxygenase protein